jgi:hypothetical protein
MAATNFQIAQRQKLHWNGKCVTENSNNFEVGKNKKQPKLN